MATAARKFRYSLDVNRRRQIGPGMMRWSSNVIQSHVGAGLRVAK